VRVYFLDRPLTDEEIDFVQHALKTTVEQVRIPHVLPAADTTKGYAGRPLLDDTLVTKHLRIAGIRPDQGSQVGLVIPRDMHWYAALAHGIYNETGFYPYLIQTAEHREQIGNPGEIRIMDMEGLAGGKD
jgi:hypothetical protein